MRLSVVISTRNRCQDLAATLRALAGLAPRPDEILVCLDGCTDHTAEMLRAEFPDVMTLVNPTARGSIPSRDRLLRAAIGELALSLDDDSHPVELGFVAAVAATFARDPRLAVLWFPQRTDEFPASLHQTDFGTDRSTGTYPSSGAVLRRSTYLELPGYAGVFEHAYEEPDYALQCIAAGWRVQYHAGLTIRHHYSILNRNERRTHQFHARNEQWSIWLRCPWPWWPLLSARRLLGQARYAARRGPGWLIREPKWWWRTLRGCGPIWRQRAPVAWRAYRRWLRLLRRPESLS
jgi:GT2 family glycosyltransferase